jgi:hypothetical protein
MSTLPDNGHEAVRVTVSSTSPQRDSISGPSSKTANVHHSGSQIIEQGTLQLETTNLAQSASRLRHVIWRLAVKLSVNDARVASQARSLAQARISHYTIQRGREAEIQSLKSALSKNEREARKIAATLAQIAPGQAPVKEGGSPPRKHSTEDLFDQLIGRWDCKLTTSKIQTIICQQWREACF